MNEPRPDLHVVLREISSGLARVESRLSSVSEDTASIKVAVYGEDGDHTSGLRTQLFSTQSTVEKLALRVDTLDKTVHKDHAPALKAIKARNRLLNWAAAAVGGSVLAGVGTQLWQWVQSKGGN